MDIEKEISEALAVANGSETPETLQVSRTTRLAHFDQPGIAPAEPAPAVAATVASSTGAGRCYRYPVLDLDVPHTYIPSDTPGHAHLYIDFRIHHGKVLVLMAALRLAGVIERGHWRGYLHRGYSAVRLPWVRKHA